MRSIVLYHVYGGDALFSAALLAIVLTVLDAFGVFVERPRAASTARIVFALTLPFAALTGTPAPLVLAIPLVCAWIIQLLLGFGLERSRWRVVRVGVFVTLTAALISVELFHQLSGAGPGGTPRRIVVLGDSLSSGGFGEEAVWPDVLEEELDLDLVNLARPSETLESAAESQLHDVPSIRHEPWGAIVELGGNDMMDGVDPDRSAAALEAILQQLDARGADPIWLVEIPVLPGHWRRAALQRRVASEREVVLIPKRILARVLSDPLLAPDGLHPSSAGHRELARRIAPWIRP